LSGDLLLEEFAQVLEKCSSLELVRCQMKLIPHRERSLSAKIMFLSTAVLAFVRYLNRSSRLGLALKLRKKLTRLQRFRDLKLIEDDLILTCSSSLISRAENAF